MERPEPERQLPIVKLLPNLLTLAAACAGLTAIRYAYQGDFEWAVRLILLAAVLDGLDGRLARLMKSQTLVGAELDSLADFLNFGVAPALILYAFTLNEIGGFGWIAALCLSLCCLMRLARFNVGQKAGTDTDSGYFQGVPSPAGAILALLPVVLSFAFAPGFVLPAWVAAIYTLAVGLLMISRIRTYSFKNITIRRENARFVLLAAVLVAAFLLIYTWVTLVIATLAYLAGIVLALRPEKSHLPPRNKPMEISAVKSSYARWAPVYDQTFGVLTGTGRRTAVGYINAGDARDVLEVGVGTGLALPLYAGDRQITGIDYSDDMLAKARTRVREQRLRHVRELRQMDARELDFPDATFDAVTAMHVISVVPEPRRVMAEIVRVLRPGGELVVTNHFARDRGVLARLERMSAPFANVLGWHSDFDMEIVTGPPELRLVREEPLPPVGMMTFLVLRKL